MRDIDEPRRPLPTSPSAEEAGEAETQGPSSPTATSTIAASVTRLRPALPERVGVLYCGGTIGMGVDGSGALVPKPSVLAGHLAESRRAAHTGIEPPEFELLTLDPLRDSAELTPADWWQMAAMIVQAHPRFGGFVVVHGTDTMAYTASALSFMLDGLDRPVVVTGAQLSLLHPRSDGRENLSTAMLIAAARDGLGGRKRCIPEVSVYFARSLLRGNRTQKADTNDFVAFRSPNFPSLARVGVDIEVSRALVRPPGPGLGHDGWSAAGPECADLRRGRQLPKIASFRIYPGLDADMLARFLDTDLDAVVLETYGTGTMPTENPALLAVLADALERGVVIVNCSQCPGGHVVQGRYGSGAALAGIGVIGGGDMTAEAALTKLHYAFGRYRDAQKVTELMHSDLAGEITPDPTH